MSRDAAQDRRELDRLADMMRARIGDLVYGIWKLQGWRDGNDFVCLNPLRADRKAGSFRIGLAGTYQGMVIDFAGEAVPGSGKKSVSPLSFHIALCHNGDNKAGVEWAKDWLGLSGRDPKALRVTTKALGAFDDRPVADEATIKKKRAAAKRIYLSGVPLWDTPGAEYYKARGLDLAKLSPLPNAARFLAECFCAELGKPNTDKAAFLPAIVLPIVGMNGDFFGVHRTYLERRDDGRWVKHSGLIDAKKTYGPYAGGVIRIWNGTRVLQNTGEVTYGQEFARAKGPLRVHLTEGPEDAWSVVLAHPDERVHAGISISNMGGLAYPESVADVVFWKQADPPDSPAAKAFAKAVANQQAQRKAVYIADVTTMCPGVKDPNDVINGAKRA